jgi:RHS repeat-associated protein
VRGVENLYGVPMAGPYTWSFTVDPQGQILTIPAPEVRKYYYHSGQRVAMRQIGLDGSDVLYFIAGDHLGTTSLVLGAQGAKVAESRHFPYGGERWRWPEDSTFPTDYRFTGQRWEQPLGIYTMGARWYDPALGRWLSGDTLVPEPGNPQAFNRYSFVRGNPLRYRDPSGHQGGPGEQAAQWVQSISPEQAAYLAEALSVAGPIGLSIVGIGVFGYGWAQGCLWVINGPLGPDYPLPEEFNPDSLNATYPLPESSTLLIDNGMFFAASGAIQSMADHLGFLFG